MKKETKDVTGDKEATKSLMVKDLPLNERPREKLLAKGAQSLNNAELLALLLKTGTKKESVVRLAERLLSSYKERELSGIAGLGVQDLCKIKGIGEAKASVVLAALELGKRLAESPPEDRTVVSSAKDAADYVMARLRYETKENFMVMLLNSKNHVLAVPTVSVGSLSASIVHPREVLRAALGYAAASMILIHNHPSGDPSPSAEDLAVTEMLVDAGDVMGIRVLDHVIIGDNKYVSLKNKGFIA